MKSADFRYLLLFLQVPESVIKERFKELSIKDMQTKEGMGGMEVQDPACNLLFFFYISTLTINLSVFVSKP